MSQSMLTWVASGYPSPQKTIDLPSFEIRWSTVGWPHGLCQQQNPFISFFVVHVPRWTEPEAVGQQ